MKKDMVAVLYGEQLLAGFTLSKNRLYRESNDATGPPLMPDCFVAAGASPVVVDEARVGCPREARSEGDTGGVLAPMDCGLIRDSRSVLLATLSMRQREIMVAGEGGRAGTEAMMSACIRAKGSGRPCIRGAARELVHQAGRFRAASRPRNRVRRFDCLAAPTCAGSGHGLDHIVDEHRLESAHSAWRAEKRPGDAAADRRSDSGMNPTGPTITAGWKMVQSNAEPIRG